MGKKKGEEPPGKVEEILGAVTSVAQFAFHYGYVPVIIYLGFRRGADPGSPPLTLLNLLWQ